MTKVRISEHNTKKNEVFLFQIYLDNSDKYRIFVAYYDKSKTIDMKKSILMISAVMMLLACGGQTKHGMSDADSTQVYEVPDTLNAVEAVKAFVEKFYKEWGGEDILDYSYPKQHITPHLLKYLADAYDYDCEGECLATWKFFYEGGGDVGALKSRQITARDGNHVLVENKYDNYEYDVLLTVIKDGDTFKIDSLKQEKSEYIN